MGTCRLVIRDKVVWQFTPLVVNIDHIRGMLYIVSDAHRNMFIAELYGDSIEEVRGYILDTCRLYRRNGLGIAGRGSLAAAIRWRLDAESNTRRKAIGGRLSWLYRDGHPVDDDRLDLELRQKRRERLDALRRAYR